YTSCDGAAGATAWRRSASASAKARRRCSNEGERPGRGPGRPLVQLLVQVTLRAGTEPLLVGVSNVQLTVAAETFPFSRLTFGRRDCERRGAPVPALADRRADVGHARVLDRPER